MSSPAAPSVRHWQIVGGSAAAQPITGGAHEAWTLLGSEDTTIELVLDDDYAIILKVGNSGEMSASGDYQLQYEVDGAGGFADVNATSSNLRSAASGDTENATATDERLSTSAQTYIGSVLDEVEGLIGTNIGGGNEFEFYFTFNLRGAELTAGAESIELRLTTGGVTFDHTAVSPILITLPALAEPPAAYLPLPKANRVEATYKLQTLAIPPEYPATPAPPVSVVAETPALKANRIEANRQIQTLGNPHVYPATPPGFRWPRPPMPTLKASFDRSRQPLAHNPVYPVTPPGFFAGQWPSHKPPPLFVTSFDRDRQKLPELNVYPAPAPAAVPVVAILKANRAAFKRALQAPLELNERPPTPPVVSTARPSQDARPFVTFNFRSRQFQQAVPVAQFTKPLVIPPGYPSFLPPVAHQISFEWHLQALPQLDEYPQTPAGFFAGQWPASLTLRPFEISFDRELQQLPQHDQWTPTPVGFFDGFYPGSKRVDSFQISFDRDLQTVPQLDEFKPPPVSAEDYAGYTPVEKFQWSFKRTLQPILNPHVYPETPAGFFAGFFPGSKRAESFAWSFDTSIQPVRLDRFPPPPVSADDYAAFTPVPTIRRRDLNRRLQSVGNPHVYPPTPPGFFAGFFPGSARVNANRTAFARRLQALPQLDRFPPKPPEPFTAYTPVLKSIVSDFERELQRLPQLDQFTPTPAGFFAGFWPGSKRVEAVLAEFQRQLQKLPPLDEFKPTPPPASIIATMPALMANRSEFDRRLLQRPEHHEYPQTPPSLIEGMAPWAMRAIRRNELGRQIQPVWNPSAIIGEGFTDHADDCKIWFAEPAYVVWEADCTWLTWEAEKICD